MLLRSFRITAIGVKRGVKKCMQRTTSILNYTDAYVSVRSGIYMSCTGLLSFVLRRCRCCGRTSTLFSAPSPSPFFPSNSHSNARFSALVIPYLHDPTTFYWSLLSGGQGSARSYSQVSMGRAQRHQEIIFADLGCHAITHDDDIVGSQPALAINSVE